MLFRESESLAFMKSDDQDARLGWLDDRGLDHACSRSCRFISGLACGTKIYGWRRRVRHTGIILWDGCLQSGAGLGLVLFFRYSRGRGGSGEWAQRTQVRLLELCPGVSIQNKSAGRNWVVAKSEGDAICAMQTRG